MKKIQIISASLPILWYAALCGETFELLGEDEDAYWTKEPSGHKNIVFKYDALLVEV